MYYAFYKDVRASPKPVEINEYYALHRLFQSTASTFAPKTFCILRAAYLTFTPHTEKIFATCHAWNLPTIKILAQIRL